MPPPPPRPPPPPPRPPRANAGSAMAENRAIMAAISARRDVVRSSILGSYFATSDRLISLASLPGLKVKSSALRLGFKVQLSRAT